MTDEINVIGICQKCGLIYLLFGEFELDDSGSLVDGLECESCGTTVVLEKEVQFI